MQKTSNDLLIDRGLPANLEAEKAILGAILLDPSAYPAAAAIVTADDFFGDQHRRIFGRMVSLRESVPVQPVDYTTLAEALIHSKELEAAGGISYLSQLTDGLPRAVNVEHYARIVKDKSVLRLLINTAHNITEEGLDGGGTGTVDEFLDRAESAILAVGEARVRPGIVTMDTAVQRFVDSLDSATGGRPEGVLTGFTRFDALTCGLINDELIVVAARPSMGKTAWAMNTVVNVAKQGNRVAVFSLEMSQESLTSRMVCSEAKIDLHKFRSGWVSKEDLRAIADAAGRLASLPIVIDDTGGIGLYEIRAKSRRLKSQGGLSLIVIDYLQLMAVLKAENRTQAIGQISRGLKGLAKELHIPIMLLSQLSRASEIRGGNDHRPILSDLRDSGDIEQDADVVAFLYREEYYAKMAGREITADLKGKAEVIVAKQRNGPTDRVPLVFLDKYASFADTDGYV